ncbi:MAG TPA: ATP-binding protein [Thermoanaerobaculia bacterium]|nr:ATP-binding protein [Thermoanaerobaculia bacterium]
MPQLYEAESLQGEWQSLAEALDTPVVLLDSDGVVLRANAAALELTGSEQGIVGEPLSRFATGEPWWRVLELLRIVSPSTPTVRAQASDVSSGLSWDISVHDLHDSTRLIVMRDVTNLLALECNARQNERVADLGRLVGNVAHEVRNPLFAMSATVDALEARYGVVESNLRRYTDNLRRELGRITALMQDLLEYGKPPLLDAKIEPISLAVGDAIDVVRKLARPKLIEIDDRSSGHDLPVLMDRSRLARAIQNLLENAIHYSPQASSIAVATDIIDIEGSCWVSCSVEDHGPGFPADALGMVFEPFYTTRPGGTGLGLSIVQRIVQMHGGRVFASNRPEGGASVAIWLPLRTESE